MKDTASGLLSLLEESGEQQCQHLRAEGQEKLAELRRKAFGRARQRVSATIRDERSRIRQAVGRVEAEIETTLRQRQLAHDGRMVDEGRRRLAEALLRAWQQPASRAAWADALLDQAAAVTIKRDWRVECPVDWSQEEQAALLRRAAEAHDVKIELQTSDGIEAGLKLLSGGLSVDMSLAGLLIDRERLDGELLDLFRSARAGEGE